jgi:hypothetical protein
VPPKRLHRSGAAVLPGLRGERARNLGLRRWWQKTEEAETITDINNVQEFFCKNSSSQPLLERSHISASININSLNTMTKTMSWYPKTNTDHASSQLKT